MNIHLARTGLCWGIDLAYKRIAADAEKGPLHVSHTWGDTATAQIWDPIRRIISDPQVVAAYPKLEDVRLAERPEDLPTGARVALGHHGWHSETIEDARSNDLTVLNHKCPFIENMDRRAEKLAASGHDLLIFGWTDNHHCHDCRDAAERHGRVGLIAQHVSEIAEQLSDEGRNWAAIAVMTGNTRLWQQFRDDLQAQPVPVKVVDTICSDSVHRQDEARDLARTHDMVLVINDGGDASKAVLDQVAHVNPRAVLVDPDGELPDVSGAESVAIVGGILISHWVQRAYAERLAAAIPDARIVAAEAIDTP